MSTLIDHNTRVLIQGITGKQGQKTTREMLDFGTHAVAGVTPGKGGVDICGLPVYNTVAEAVRMHPEINTSLISVPREGTKDAALEAIACPQIKLVNILTEGVPQRDAAAIVQAARENNTRVIGPSSIGVINPLHRVKLGAIGGNDPGVFYPGPIAIFSKSGGMCLSIATEVFNALGLGVSLVVGIGGDRVTGANFKELLELVRDDPQTSLVILMGEVGGDYEEEAAEYIRQTNYPKPVVARITGIGAQNIFPRGSRMGHAGAIIGEGNFGTYESKIAAFENAHVNVAKTSAELIAFVRQAMPSHGPDFEAAMSKEYELVSIAKNKLESLKGQVRAVQLRTHLTQIIEGTPHFRGRSLPQLMRNASAAQMIYEAITQEDASPQQASRLACDLVICAKRAPADEAARRAAVAAFQGGSPINVAVAAGLLTLASTPRERVASHLHCQYLPTEGDALLLIPQVIDLIGCILGNQPQWSDDANLETTVFETLSGRKPSDAEANLLRAIFVSCVDHTPATPSSLAAITSYSGGNALKTALAAGITAMGESHAGAGEGAARIFAEYVAKMREAQAGSGVLQIDGVRITNQKELAGYVVNRVTGVYGGPKNKVPGYGHRHYSLYGRDPRAVTLLAIADELGLAGDHCTLAREIELILKQRKALGLCFNVDGVIGALLCDLKLPPEAGKALFIIPRTVGLLGQLLEQDPGSFFRLSNNSIIYIGPQRRD